MRALRTEDPTAFYHVGSKGNDGRWIFGDDADRRLFLVLLERAARRHGWVVLAYCLMTNHYHLVICIPDGGLSAGMQLLNTGYSQLTNARYGSTGHLFRNRFHSVAMSEEAHLLEGCRYVVLNPVRAGVCTRAEEWPWSSYRACAGLSHAPAFLAVGELLELFAPEPSDARRVYCDFVSAGHVQGQTPVRESDALVRG